MSLCLSSTPVLNSDYLHHRTKTGRTFPVTKYFLEDAFQATNFEFAANSQCISKGPGRGAKKTVASPVDDKAAKRLFIDALRKGKKYSEKTLTSLDIVDESVINTELILKLVLHIIANTSTTGKGKGPKGAADGAAPVEGEAEGAILIFVPGLANIQGEFFPPCCYCNYSILNLCLCCRCGGVSEGEPAALRAQRQHQDLPAALLTVLARAEHGLPAGARGLEEDRGRYEHSGDFRDYRRCGVRDRHMQSQGE